MRRSTLPVDRHLRRRALLAFVTLAPMLWLFIMSIMQPRELIEIPLRWLPETPTSAATHGCSRLHRRVADNAFLIALRNSLVVAGWRPRSRSPPILAAYLPRFPGRMPMLYADAGHLHDAADRLHPAALHDVQRARRAQQSLTLVRLLHLLLPFATWLLKANFDVLPVEVEDAAAIDGAGTG